MQLSLGPVRAGVVINRAVTIPAPLLPAQPLVLGLSPGHVTCFGQCSRSGRALSFSQADMFRAQAQSAMCSFHRRVNCGCTFEDDASQPRSLSECMEPSPVANMCQTCVKQERNFVVLSHCNLGLNH